MAGAGQFFSPWEAPPSFTPKPEDPALLDRISKLVQYAAQNGPSFIEMVANKQQNNPEYAFLQPGTAQYGFFRWHLYCQLYNHPIDQPLEGAAPAQPQAPPQQPDPLPTPAAPSTPYGLPADAHAGFTQVLASLTGSKEAIKSSQAWFMSSAHHAQGLALMMAERTVHLAEPDKQLHVIYLANDILFKSLATRQPNTEFSADAIAMAFHPVLASMAAAAYTTSGRADATKAKLSKILRFWEERKVYNKEYIEYLAEQMEQGDAAALFQHAVSTTAAAAAAANAAQPDGTVAAGQAEQQAQQQQVPPQQQPVAPAAAAAGQPQGFQPVAGMPYAAAAGYPAAGVMPHQGAPPAAAGAPGYLGAAAPAGTSWLQPGVAPPAAAPGAGPAAPWGAPGPMPPAYPGAAPPAYPGAAPGSVHPPAVAAPPGWPPHAAVPGAVPGMPSAQHYPPPGHPAGAAWYPPPPGPGVAYPPGAAPAPVPPHYPPPGGYPAPGAPAAPRPAPPAYAPPPSHPQQPPQQQQPASSFSFPPGLIPQLSKDKSRYGEPYTPLSAADIEDAGLPGPPKEDAYLTSRLERFYAEIQGFRPGDVRAELLEDLQREVARDRRERDQEEGGRRGRHEADPDTNMHADGSFAGMGPGSGMGAGSRFGGLGSHRGGSTGDDGDISGDIYSSYRRVRSDSYKDMIFKNIGGSNMARGGR